MVISLREKYVYKMGVNQLLVESCVNESDIHVNKGVFFLTESHIPHILVS